MRLLEYPIYGGKYGSDLGWINRHLLKIEVLTQYGNGKLACVKCGFSDIRALSIDHINSNGGEERRNLKKFGGTNFYKWLQKGDYPEGYQTLCMNCQFIKRAEKREYSKGPVPKVLPAIDWIHTNEEYASIISGED